MLKISVYAFATHIPTNDGGIAAILTNQTFFAGESSSSIVVATHAHYLWFTKSYGPTMTCILRTANLAKCWNEKHTRDNNHPQK